MNTFDQIRTPPAMTDYQDLPFVVWRADANGHWLHVNPAWQALTGQHADQALGLGWLARIAAGDRGPAMQAIERAVGERHAVLLRCGLRDPEDVVRPCMLSINPSPRLDGPALYGSAAAVYVNAVEQRQYEDALYLREREFKALVETSPDLVARLDRDGRHLYVNRAIEAAFGLPALAFFGKTACELALPEHLCSAYDNALKRVLASAQERKFDFSLRLGGRSQHFTARATPEFDRDTRVESVLLVISDITERTEAQLERDALLIREQASRMQAEGAARARDEFLAIVSHELRSPLNGIQSWTHVLEAYVPMDQPMVLRALTGIKIGVQQQVRLIEDLLDATLIMSGKLRLSKSAVALDSCIDGAIQTVAALVEEKRIKIRKHLPAVVPLIEADGKRLQQVIWNLLSNAVKFTPDEGVIDIEVDLLGNEIMLGIRDNGRGIATQFLPYLFDPFRQADESSTRRAGGIGLGLTLVRRLTELHGGRVSAQSAGENCGALFTVVLPLGTTPLPAPEEPTVRRHGAKALESLQGLRVALVDDLKEARDSLAQLLEQAGGQVTSFASGRDVVDFLRRIELPLRPDVLICDIAMPEQDGYRTLQQIRELESIAGVPQLPAIALTAFSQHEDEIKALASGFQLHMAKPVEPAELIAILAAVTARGTKKVFPVN